MNDTFVTIVGNVVAQPRHITTQSGTSVLSLRVASTPRRFDRGLGEWRDGPSLYVTVSCWRGLADNVAASVDKGDPVIVTGRLRVRSYDDREGVRRVSVEVEASSVGHDLARGVTRFQRVQRVAAGGPADRPAVEPATDIWAVPGEPAALGDTVLESAGAGDGTVDSAEPVDQARQTPTAA